MLPGHALLTTSTNKNSPIKNYKFLGTIGEGGYGKVKLARHLPTGTEVAVKVIPKNRQDPSSLKRLYREVQSLKALNHPNVVQLYEVIDTEQTLFLIMEYVGGGNMDEYIEDQGHMTEDEARGKFRQLVSAVHYCHQKGIVHRDLKPENILFDDDMNVKVSDFGLSNVFIGRVLGSYCGTLYCTAPEILLLRNYIGPPVDVWSLGVSLYVMLTGEEPFPGEGFATIKMQVLTGLYPVYPVELSVECVELLRKMMTLDPTLRITLEDIMSDPWVNMGEEKLRPYRELPSDNRDPWVIKVMMNMGFKWDKIQESLRRRKYDHLMGMYLILTSKRPKAEGHTVSHGSIPSFDPKSRRSLPACEVLPEVSSPTVRCVRTEPALPTWFRGADQWPGEKQESELKAEEPASPPPSPESRTASPNPTPQHGPGAFPSTHSTSSSEASVETNSSNVGQPSGATPTSPGPSQGRRGAAGRFFNFIRHFCLCLPSKKKRGRHNRVKPL